MLRMELVGGVGLLVGVTCMLTMATSVASCGRAQDSNGDGESGGLTGSDGMRGIGGGGGAILDAHPSFPDGPDGADALSGDAGMGTSVVCGTVTCPVATTYCHTFSGYYVGDGGPISPLLSAGCDQIPASCTVADCSCFPTHDEGAFHCVCVATKSGGIEVGCSAF